MIDSKIQYLIAGHNCLVLKDDSKTVSVVWCPVGDMQCKLKLSNNVTSLSSTTTYHLALPVNSRALMCKAEHHG